MLICCSISKKTPQERFGHLEKTGEIDFNSSRECAATCIQRKPSNRGDLIFVYNGSETNNPYVVNATQEIGKQEVWVKKYDKKTDSYIWCLEGGEPQVIQYQAVLDTHKVKDFDIYNDKLEFEQIKESLPTICKEEETEYFYYQLSLKLYEEGYLPEKYIYREMLPSIKLALTNYQLNNNLCSGAITLETLTALNLKSY